MLQDLQERNLKEISMGELQEIIEQICECYKGSKDKSERKKLKIWYAKLAALYNTQANTKIYYDTL